MKHKFLTLTLTLILFFILVPPALAQGPVGDQVVLGRDLVLKAGEKIDGDVVVFGGNVTIPATAEIDGDMILFGGNADVKGTVSGDIGLVGGNINLGEGAVVGGNIGLVGGAERVAAGAVVKGQIQNLNRFTLGSGTFDWEPPAPPVSPLPATPPIPPVPRIQHQSEWSPASSFVGQIIYFIKHVLGNAIFLIALAAVSWVVVAIIPDQTKLVGDTIVETGPFSFVVGLVTVTLALVVGSVLLITICLAFIPILAALLIGIAVLLGWIAAGQVIGERLLVAGGRPFPNLVSSTLLGVIVLTIVSKMPIISLVPCLGFFLAVLGGLVGIIVALTGLGAVILTRFGTRPYSPRRHSYRSGPQPGGPEPAARSEPGLPEASALERAEAELKAKIKAALDEAEVTGVLDKEPGPQQAKPAGETEPTADKPEPETPDTPADQTPGDEPDQAPKPES